MATNNDPGEQSENPTGQNSEESYADSYLRVSKDNVYMIIALWMENFDYDPPEGYNKVGAVLVLPNDVIFAADCSRDDVHAVARLLMKHCDKVEGCKMFMSRKPCSFCAKLLVQSKVERVLFLPFEPEYYRSPEAGDQKNEVDILFTARPIAQTIFVFHIDESVLQRARGKTPTDEKNNVNDKKDELIKKYSAFKHNSPWMKSVKEELPWKIFDDKIAKKVCDDFQNFMEWIARVFVIAQSKSKSQPDRAKGLNYDFEFCGIARPKSGAFNPVNDEQAEEQAEQQAKKQAERAEEKAKQTEEQAKEQAKQAKNQAAKRAKHFITIARFLATRTDDPTAGVGAVIVNPEMEILGLGWNGFPLKAQYGKFGRGLDEPADKKYPYVIHAEQNALLMRNEKKIKDAILFVTRTPCDECTPLIAMQGIKTVVVDEDVVARAKKPEKENGLSYKKFLKKVTEGKFVCFQTKNVDAKNISASEQTSQKLPV